MLNFFKKFIYYTMSVFGLISLSLIPTKLYSQQQTHNLWWNLKKTVTIPTPHINQELPLYVINWPDFIVDIVDIVDTRDIYRMSEGLNSDDKKRAKFFDRLFQEYATHIEPLDIERFDKIVSILVSTDPKEQPMSSLLWAIINKDDDFLRQLSLQQQETLLFNSRVFVHQSSILPFPIAWDFLTEAILSNNLTAVRMILESDIRKQNKAEKYRLYDNIDPLSLSLVNYASLPKGQASKKMAQQIVRLMAEHTPNVNDISSLTWHISPITWALTLGLKDEVEYLVKHKQARLVSTLEIKNTIMEINIDTLEYLKLRKFNNLKQYVKQFKLNDTVEDCKTVFH